MNNTKLKYIPQVVLPVSNLALRHLKFLISLGHYFLSKFMSYWYNFVSKNLLVTSTPLMGKMMLRLCFIIEI